VQLAALAGIVIASWANLEIGDRRAGRAALLGPFFLVALGAAGVLLLSGSVVLGRLALALAASGAGAVGVLLGTGARSPLQGMTPVVATVLTALVVVGHVYASVPGTCAVLLAAAPVGVWAGRIGPARRLAPWQAMLLDTSASLIPVAFALGLAWAASPALE
jgi:hypothetical protein